MPDGAFSAIQLYRKAVRSAFLATATLLVAYSLHPTYAYAYRRLLTYQILHVHVQFIIIN